MLAEHAVMDREAHVVAATERLCIATRQVRPVGELIRFVVGADGAVVPDLRRRLPGRGVWITARRYLIEEAVRRRMFGHGLKAEIRVSAGLPDELDRLLEQSALDALSIAHKAGLVIPGPAKAAAAVTAAPLVALLRARDGGEKGSQGLEAAFMCRTDVAAEGKIVEAFTSAQLDLALSGLNVVHAALLAGRASETFLARWRFLKYFRADKPGDRNLSLRRRNGTTPEPGS